MQDWPTKYKDLGILKFYLETYQVFSGNENKQTLFEWHLDSNQKNFQMILSPWMQAMILHFMDLYGVEQGEHISRKLLTYCLTQGQVLH